VSSANALWGARLRYGQRECTITFSVNRRSTYLVQEEEEGKKKNAESDSMQQTETETTDVLNLLDSVEPAQFTVRLLPSYYNAFMEEAEEIAGQFAASRYSIKRKQFAQLSSVVENITAALKNHMQSALLSEEELQNVSVRFFNSNTGEQYQVKRS